MPEFENLFTYLAWAAVVALVINLAYSQVRGEGLEKQPFFDGCFFLFISVICTFPEPGNTEFSPGRFLMLRDLTRPSILLIVVYALFLFGLIQRFLPVSLALAMKAENAESPEPEAGTVKESDWAIWSVGLVVYLIGYTLLYWSAPIGNGFRFLAWIIFLAGTFRYKYLGKTPMVRKRKTATSI